MFKKAINIFSSYANKDERLVAAFFNKLNHNDSKIKVTKALTHLIQKNIIAQNLWCESRYKGYKYLNKYTRINLYKNADLITQDYYKYINNSNLDYQHIKNEVSAMVPAFKFNNQDINKLLYLRGIMGYLSPANKRYEYRTSSSFGELLKDPNTNTLVGDCNQIVTLYIYLYSLKFDILDLKLSTYPGHVALHFKGVDIEATNGSFADYSSRSRQILPIYEIASINLMDTTDSYYKTYTVSNLATLQAAHLAYNISSQTKVAMHNLKSAYNNVIIDFVKTNNYKKALRYAKQSPDATAINYVAQNAVKFYLNNHNFVFAKKYHIYTDNQNELQKIINKNEAIFYYNKRDYARALSIFKQYNDTAMIKNCYMALFVAEQKKLGNINSVDDIRKNRKTILKMADYAQRAQNEQLIRYVSNLKNCL